MAANYVHHVKIELILQDGNTWEAFVTDGYSHAAAGIAGGGSKILAGVLDGIRLTTVGGAELPDAGTYTPLCGVLRMVQVAKIGLDGTVTYDEEDLPDLTQAEVAPEPVSARQFKPQLAIMNLKTQVDA